MTDDRLLLVVLLGQPGTGKTTLAKRLAAELRGAYIRLDAIVGPMLGGGPTREALGMRLAVETSDADSALAEAVQHLSRRNCGVRPTI
jgi:predicted kinase